MKTNYFILTAALLIFFGCRGQVSNPISAQFEKGKTLAELTDKKLKETSGLSASVQNPGSLWAVCDKGNSPEIYLIDKDLNIKFTVTLQGVSNRDWEDIAVGPGPEVGTTYIYVGDIGDNDAVYPVKYIYRFKEPTLSTEANIALHDFDKITFRLEDAIKDTESLFIDSKTRNLFVVSKREEPVFVYMLSYPQSLSDTVIASKALSLPFEGIVAADCSPETGDILMKNYDKIFYRKNTSGLDPVSLLKTQPEEVPYEKELQGESITWATDAPGFYTLGEMKKKQPTYLYFYSKK